MVNLAVMLIWAASGTPADYTVTTVALPGASPAGITMDYIAYDPATRQVWVPAGNTGAVDVIDAATGKVRQVTGFPTAEMGTATRKRVAGPSSVTIGRDVVYVGNRGDSSICAIDPVKLTRGVCHRLDSMPDGVAYVASTQEVWVTTPRDKSVRVLDAKTLDEKARLALDGSPEGFAVDGKRHRFYTNLEDKDRTLAIDLQSRKTAATWKPGCGEEGPRGLRVDAAAGQLFVACTARVEVMDIAHDGQILSSIETEDGVDDIDYAPARHLVYAGAARAGKLTIASVGSDGKLSLVARIPTQVGARNAAVTADGHVYLAHSSAGNLSDIILVSP